MKSQRIKLLGLGIVISSVFLYLALRGMDWHALQQTLLNIQIGSLIFCAGMIMIGILLRGWRWSLIAGRSIEHVLPFVRATNLGILGNQLLPMRLGEVIRIVALKRFLPTSLYESVASALIDRIFDVVILFISAWLVSTLIVGAFLPQGLVLWMGAALALLGMGLVIVRTQPFHAWLTAWSERYLHRWSLRPDSFVSVFNSMTGQMTHYRIGCAIVGIALLVWLVDYLAVLAALWSIGLDLPLVVPLLLWVMLAAGSALPSAPGYVGIYQLAAVLTLSAYDIPAYQAVAVSLVLQGSSLLVSLVGGVGGEGKLLWSATSNYAKKKDT